MLCCLDCLTNTPHGFKGLLQLQIDTFPHDVAFPMFKSEWEWLLSLWEYNYNYIELNKNAKQVTWVLLLKANHVVSCVAWLATMLWPLLVGWPWVGYGSGIPIPDPKSLPMDTRLSIPVNIHTRILPEYIIHGYPYLTRNPFNLILFF